MAMKSKKDEAEIPFSRRSFLAMASTTIVGSTTEMMNAGTKRTLSRIDIQSHLYVPEMIDLMKSRISTPNAYEKNGETYVVTGQWHRRLRKDHTK